MVLVTLVASNIRKPEREYEILDMPADTKGSTSSFSLLLSKLEVEIEPSFYS